LDKNIDKIVHILKRKNIPCYFSCNPASIGLEQAFKVLDAGLDYLKFSSDSIPHFVDSSWRILEILDEKKRRGWKTTIVISLVGTDCGALRQLFSDLDVYIYGKSQDQQWLKEGNPTKSIHWSEFCQFAWSSMSITSSGAVVPCCADYNDELVIGDCKTDSLYEIWNGDKYRQFRRNHLSTPHEKCAARCDMKTVGILAR
jgi:radical SAM protein with 4Fe4S-binding SPASM domain